MAIVTRWSNILNNTIDAPDNVDPLMLQQAEQDMYLQQQQQQQQQILPQGQQAGGGGGGALGFLGNLVNTATDYMSAPGTFYAPSVAGAYAMTPEGFNQHMTRMQGTLNQANAQRAQAQENAAERQQQSAIEQQRNRMEMQKMLQDQKDRQDLFKIKKQELDMQVQEHEYNRKIKEFELQQAQEKAERGETYTGAGGSIHNITWGSDGTPNVRTLVPPTFAPERTYYAPRYTPDGQVITYDPATGTSRADPVEGYIPAQKPPKTVNITKDGETNTYYQYPDGTLSVVPVPQEETAGAGPEEQLTLQEIARNTNATSWLGDRNYTNFVHAARAQGFSDEEIASYAQQKGIADDNSNFPFYGGTNTNISDIPRKTETYEVPANNPTGNPSPDAAFAYEAGKTQFLKDHPEIRLDLQGSDEEKAQAMRAFDQWYQDNVEVKPAALLPSGPAPAPADPANVAHDAAPQKGTYNGVEGMKVGNMFYPKDEWIRDGGSW